MASECSLERFLFRFDAGSLFLIRVYTEGSGSLGGRPLLRFAVGSVFVDICCDVGIVQHFLLSTLIVHFISYYYNVF